MSPSCNGKRYLFLAAFSRSCSTTGALSVGEKPLSTGSFTAVTFKSRRGRHISFQNPSWRAFARSHLRLLPQPHLTLWRRLWPRGSYGSFWTAWNVRRDFLLLRGASSRRTAAEI